MFLRPSKHSSNNLVDGLDLSLRVWRQFSYCKMTWLRRKLCFPGGEPGLPSQHVPTADSQRLGDWSGEGRQHFLSVLLKGPSTYLDPGFLA